MGLVRIAQVGAVQFAQRVARHPAGGGVGRTGQNLAGAGDGRLTGLRTALTDLAQRPVDGFLDEIALIRRGGENERKELLEIRVGTVLGVDGQPRQGGKGCPADKFFLACSPGVDFLVRIRGAVKQAEADLVAHVPRVEFRDPGVHLLRRNLTRVLDQRRQNARLMQSALPQFQRQSVTMDAARAIARRAGIERPSGLAGLTPKRAMPATAAGLACACSAASISSAEGTGLAGIDPFQIGAIREAFAHDGDGLRIGVHQHKAAAQFQAGRSGGARPGKEIQDGISGVG